MNMNKRWWLVALPGAARGESCPAPYDSYDANCSTYCGYDSVDGRIECDGFAVNAADTVYALSDPDGGDYPAIFGSAGGTLFCCDDTGWDGVPIYIATKGGNDAIYLRDGESNWNETSEVWSGADNDTVYGSNYDCGAYPCDAIYPGNSGGESMDHVYAGGGPDKVQAPVDDTGENWLEGEDGDDKLWGGPNDDLLFGGSGSDQILCGAGDDYAEGGDDADWIQGNEGVDELYGQGGLDRLCGVAGEVDTIDGGYENPMPTNMCAEDNEDSMTNCPYQYDTCAELW